MNPPSKNAWTVALMFLGLSVLWTIFPGFLSSYDFRICATLATLATIKVLSGPLSTFWRVLFSTLAGLGGFLVGLYVVVWTGAKTCLIDDPETTYAVWCHAHLPALMLFGCVAGFAILFIVTYKLLLPAPK